MASSKGSPDSGLNPGLLCLLHWQAGCLPLVPPGKPLNEEGRNEYMNLSVKCISGSGSLWFPQLNFRVEKFCLFPHLCLF